MKEAEQTTEGYQFVTNTLQEFENVKPAYLGAMFKYRRQAKEHFDEEIEKAVREYKSFDTRKTLILLDKKFVH